MQGQLTSAMMCDPPERIQFGFQKAEVPAITNTVDRQCSLVHPETHFVNPLLVSHADGVKSYRRRCQSQRGRPTPDALCSRGSLCGHVMSLEMCGLGRQRSGPSSQRCAGKESLMACHSSGRIVTVPVYVSWDAEMLPPNPYPNPNPKFEPQRVQDMVSP